MVLLCWVKVNQTLGKPWLGVPDDLCKHRSSFTVKLAADSLAPVGAQKRPEDPSGAMGAVAGEFKMRTRCQNKRWQPASSSGGYSVRKIFHSLVDGNKDCVVLYCVGLV